METRLKIDQFTYLLILFVGLVCVLRAATLYYWWHIPEIETPSSPAIYKGVEYPGVSFVTLLVSIPCITVLLLPLLRALPRVIFLSGIMVSFGIASIVGSWYLSFNVSGGGGVFHILGVKVYILATTQFNKTVMHTR